MSIMMTGIFQLPEREVTCPAGPGMLLTDAAEAAGVVLNVACGGTGKCGGCAIDLIDGAFLNADDEPITLDGRPRRVLACRTRLGSGDFRVRVPAHSLVAGGEKILVDFEHLPPWTLRPTVAKEHLRLPAPSLADQAGDIERTVNALRGRGYDGRVSVSLHALRDAPQACRQGDYRISATLVRRGSRWRVTRIEPGDTTERLYGLAIDVGTTTVVCALVDLRSGEIVDSASSYNQQVRRCNDVAGRISYASTGEAIDELRRLVVDATINRLLRMLIERRGITPADVGRVSVAGNNVMTHLLLGVDPTHLGGVPFQPASNFPPAFAAEQVGIAIHPAAPIDVAPATAAYLGGDITSDLYVAGLHQAEELALLVDIGTNAEIAIGNRDRIIACAAPAGPAFEGQGLTCGARAATGAIDTLVIDPADFECRYTVIGESAPSGVCGSGLIDFVGQAFGAGLLTAAGRYDIEAAKARSCGRLKPVPTPDGEALGYVLAEAEETDDKLRPLAVTEADVATLLQAKGVIFAGIQIAAKHLGKSFTDIRRVVLAGGFARHIELANAVAMGLLPDIPLDRYRFIGNGSLAGAYLRLIDQTVGPTLDRIAARPEVIELNLDPEFQDAYTCAMLLPNVNDELFPSLRRGAGPSVTGGAHGC